MKILSGDVEVTGSISYSSQDGWIQNCSLRDNILFGSTYNEKKYQKILNICCLVPDIKILKGGDLTEIGEKGFNLSGGQKQSKFIYY